MGKTRKTRADRRRKPRLDSMVHDLTDLQWAALKDAWAGCAYCGASDTPLQRDRVLPISRGGRYTLDNVVPAGPREHLDRAYPHGPNTPGHAGHDSPPDNSSRSGVFPKEWRRYLCREFVDVSKS